VLRILHVAQPVETGVAEVVLTLAAHQHARGHHVVVACPPHGMLPERARALGVEVVAWPARRQPGPATLGEARRLARIVAATRPDLVHLHSAKAGLAGRLGVRGRRPTLFQPHAWSFHAATGPVRAGALGWERLAARWTDRVLAVSAAEAEEGRAAGIVAAVARTPNGVDTDRFTVSGPDDRAAARAALGLADVPTAVCVGRLCPQKGQDLAIVAWSRVRAAVPDATLVLVGDGPDEAALAAAAGPGVRLAGAQRDVVPWLAAADLAVAPSRWEGQSLALLEAMASGLPVVASDVAGVRESLAPDGGSVVPAGDADAFAAAVADHLGDLDRCRLAGAANRTRACADHGVAAAAARVEDVYAEVLAERAR
jgi:glycosyltransferase involved in cell wall biosynthesis